MSIAWGTIAQKKNKASRAHRIDGRRAAIYRVLILQGSQLPFQLRRAEILL
jgi:hypothetical protein